MPTCEPLSDAEQIERFLSGACASFAIGAWEALGRPEGSCISVLIDDDGEPNTEDDRCVAHAFLSIGGADMDARGFRTPEAMADDYGLNGWTKDGPFTPDNFRSMFCGDDGPLEFDEADAAMAGDFVRRHRGERELTDMGSKA